MGVRNFSGTIKQHYIIKQNSYDNLRLLKTIEIPDGYWSGDGDISLYFACNGRSRGVGGCRRGGGGVGYGCCSRHLPKSA